MNNLIKAMIANVDKIDTYRQEIRAKRKQTIESGETAPTSGEDDTGFLTGFGETILYHQISEKDDVAMRATFATAYRALFEEALYSSKMMLSHQTKSVTGGFISAADIVLGPNEDDYIDRLVEEVDSFVFGKDYQALDSEEEHLKKYPDGNNPTTAGIFFEIGALFQNDGKVIEITSFFWLVGKWVSRDADDPLLYRDVLKSSFKD